MCAIRSDKQTYRLLVATGPVLHLVSTAKRLTLDLIIMALYALCSYKRGLIIFGFNLWRA